MTKTTFEILGQPVAKQRAGLYPIQNCGFRKAYSEHCRTTFHRANPWPRQSHSLGNIQTAGILDEEEDSRKFEHAAYSTPRSGQCGEGNL